MRAFDVPSLPVVIAHVDETFTKGSPAEIQALKDNWGLGVMTHLDDVAGSRKTADSIVS